MTGSSPATEGAPASVQIAVLSSAALIVVQGVLLVGAALVSIGDEPYLEIVLAIVLGLAVLIAVPACVSGLRLGRPGALPTYVILLGTFIATGIARTIRDISFGSVSMIVLSVVIGVFLVLPDSRAWVTAAASARRIQN